MLKQTLSGLAVAAVLALSTTAQGAIIFESVALDLSNVSPTSLVAGTAANDNTWNNRSGFGEGDVTILELWQGEPTSPDVLEMTIDGLTAGGLYDVYVNYIRFGASTSDTDGDRGGAYASLDGVNYSLFNAAGGTAGTVGFSELTGHVDGDRVGLRGYLGAVNADASGEVSFFVNADAAVEERVWFDGGSVAVVPEPASLALMGLGCLVIGGRRRR